MPFDLSLPVVAAPMFLVWGPDLIIARARAGIIGAMPAFNARSTDQLDTWLDRIDTETSALRAAEPTRRIGPHAMNLIVHSTNPRLEADLDIVVKHRVPIVFASVGNPGRVRERIQAYGGKVFADVTSVQHARRSADSGVDALVLLCAGAWGNCGWLSPFAVVPEVRRFWNGHLVAAGAIGTGAAVRAVQMLGADLAYVGTRSIATTESMANGGYREMLIASRADDVLLTSEVTGIPAKFPQDQPRTLRLHPRGRPQGVRHRQGDRGVQEMEGHPERRPGRGGGLRRHQCGRSSPPSTAQPSARAATSPPCATCALPPKPHGSARSSSSLA